jgi:hypothetical protein
MKKILFLGILCLTQAALAKRVVITCNQGTGALKSFTITSDDSTEKEYISSGEGSEEVEIVPSLYAWNYTLPGMYQTGDEHRTFLYINVRQPTNMTATMISVQIKDFKATSARNSTVVSDSFKCAYP